MSTQPTVKGNKNSDVEEKLIPWEPYRAAVSPIKLKTEQNPTCLNVVKIPYKVETSHKTENLPKLDNIPLSSTSTNTAVVEQTVPHNDSTGVNRYEPVPASVHEMGDGKPSAEEERRQFFNRQTVQQQLSDGEKYKKLVYDFETLVVERDSLMEQLQVHIKVNAELKKLLVATMGDDLELKMECLTNDKARLAQDIVHYTSKLSFEQENLERSNIQCDVWRSKFLASSIMVDELVSWKFYLIRQLEESQKTIKNVLEEHGDFRKHLYQTFLLLQETKEALDPLMQGKYRHLAQYHTIYDLVTTVHSLSDALHHRLLNNRRTLDFYGEKREPIVGLTDAELAANKLLSVDTNKLYASSPCEDFQKLTDKQAKLMGYPTQCNFRNLTINCCRKCAGEIKLV